MRDEKGFWARLSASGRGSLGRVGVFLGCRRRSASLRLVPLLAVASLPLLLPLLPAAALIHYVYFDRSDLPDLEPFIRFEPPTTGSVYDARGEVLIELAGEYRKVVSYDEVPTILRQAILAAEDKNFFVHSGVEYRALPRVDLEDGGALFDRVVEWRLQVPAAAPPRRVDVDAATRPRLFPPRTDRP